MYSNGLQMVLFHFFVLAILVTAVYFWTISSMCPKNEYPKSNTSKMTIF